MKNNIWGETERLYIEKMSMDDFQDISEMLKSTAVANMWEHIFSNRDIKNWIKNCENSYKNTLAGYFIIKAKQSNKKIGQISLSDDTIEGKIYYEIGYMLKDEYKGRGYATEAAKYMVNFAFNKLNLKEVILEIRPENLASIKIAKRLKAKENGHFFKNIKGKKIKHIIFTIKNPNNTKCR